MQVTSKINIDLRQSNTGARVEAVQNDVNTRAVAVSLFDGGAAWTVPSGVSTAVGYKKPDGTKGTYNKLPDGTAAVTISGSVATIILAQQMLTVPGVVSACLVFNDASLNQLTSFPFTVRVEANPAADAQKSEDYVRLEWLDEKLEEKLAEYIQRATGDANAAAAAANEAADNANAAAELAIGTATLEVRLRSGKLEDAELHLGFYIDDNGYLCQKEG